MEDNASDTKLTTCGTLDNTTAIFSIGQDLKIHKSRLSVWEDDHGGCTPVTQGITLESRHLSFGSYQLAKGVATKPISVLTGSGFMNLHTVILWTEALN